MRKGERGERREERGEGERGGKREERGGKKKALDVLKCRRQKGIWFFCRGFMQIKGPHMVFDRRDEHHGGSFVEQPSTPHEWFGYSLDTRKTGDGLSFILSPRSQKRKFGVARSQRIFSETHR